MNLASTISIYAGGPGSGCNPEVGKCGRKKGSGSGEKPGRDLKTLTDLGKRWGLSVPAVRKTLEQQDKTDATFGNEFGGHVVDDGNAVVTDKEIVLYHVTHKDLAGSIRRKGLLPSEPGRGDERPLSGVYLTRKNGIGHYGRMVKEDGGKPVTFEVKIPAGTKLVHDPNNEMDVYMETKVPAKWLKLV